MWSADVERGTAVAQQIDTGAVGVNTCTLDGNAPPSMDTKPAGWAPVTRA
ncbi:hypothetical protein [Nocardia aurea]